MFEEFLHGSTEQDPSVRRVRAFFMRTLAPVGPIFGSVRPAVENLSHLR